jgi:predicted ribosomally synthesized peptide with SipW-like signal peptide
MKLRAVAMTGVLSLAGLALIGAGAHAAFTTSTTSSQQISTGTMNVQLYSSNALSGNGSANLVLNNYGPIGSTFSTGQEEVQIYNAGSIPVSGVSATFGASGSSALWSELNVCLVGSDGALIWEGPLNAATGTASISDIGPIASGGWSAYYVDYYAGPQTLPGSCGYTSAPALDNSVLNTSVIPTVTITYNG